MAAGFVTRGTTCGVWEYSETGRVGPRMSDSDKILDQISDAQRNLSDDTMFRECVSRTLTALRVDDIDFANDLAVSRSAVNRWKTGRSVPHPAMRKPVYAALKRRAREALRVAKPIEGEAGR